MIDRQSEEQDVSTVYIRRMEDTTDENKLTPQGVLGST